MIGVYFHTWASEWTDIPEQMDLAQIQADVVNISFCDPKTDYRTRYSFLGTGLEFPQPFSTVVSAIDILKSRGTKVMLSVGGSTYLFNSNRDYTKIVTLMHDLHCDGIDIDWEPTGGITSSVEWGQIIKAFADLMPVARLSAAVFSTGAYAPAIGDNYRGINIPGLITSGSRLHWLNLMAYDAGKQFDPISAFEAYKNYYKNPVLVGFEIGKQGWGDDLLTITDVQQVCNYVSSMLRHKDDGVFIWGYGSNAEGLTPTYDQVLAEIKTVLKVPKPPSATEFKCPNCSILLTVSIK